MSNTHNGGGLYWSPFFNVLEDEKNNFLKNLHLEKEKIDLSKFVIDCFRSYDDDLKEAVKGAILRWSIEISTFASDILSEEDYLKAKETYKRRQYQSGVLKKLVDCFLLAQSELRDYKGNYVVFNTESFKLALYSDVKSEYDEIKNQRVKKNFEALKRVIEKIASGAKAECYLNASNCDFYEHQRKIKNELNDYVKEKYGYNYNDVNLYEEFVGKANELLQLALVNDKDFWLNKKFNVAKFINEIYEKNSKAHAIKVINYIFDNLLKNETVKSLIKAKLPLYYDNQFFIDYFKAENKYLLYPLLVAEDCEQKINEGKKFFEDFLYDFVYPSNKEQIKERLKSILKNEGEARYTIYDVLSYITTKSYFIGKQKDALNIVCPEFFTEESLWKRVYLKVYYMSRKKKDESLYQELFEKFYNLFAIIEHETGIQTAIQLDDETRNNSYDTLKASLKRFDVSISDENKNDYITALVDIRSARMSEADRFPVLEQLGDAIYNFAVSEMIFYNPYYDDYEDDALNPTQRFEKYICAKGQLKIAKMLKLDKMYISTSRALDKSDEKIIVQVYDCNNNKKDDSAKGEKYLADTLEMILGAVCLDKGYKIAIDLAKRMIRDAYGNDFPEEVRYSKENAKSEKYDMDYFLRIRPGLYQSVHEMQSYGVADYIELMRDSLYKLLGCIVLGTEDVMKREYISYGISGIARLFNDKCTYISLPFYCYLTEGVDTVVETFGENALEKYAKEISIQ